MNQATAIKNHLSDIVLGSWILIIHIFIKSFPIIQILFLPIIQKKTSRTQTVLEYTCTNR